MILVKARQLNESKPKQMDNHTMIDKEKIQCCYWTIHVKPCGLNDLCTLVLLTFTILFTVSLTLIS